MIAFSPLFSTVFVARSGKREHTVDWAAAQLDWPTLSNTEVFSATKKHIFSVEIFVVLYVLVRITKEIEIRLG